MAEVHEEFDVEKYQAEHEQPSEVESAVLTILLVDMGHLQHKVLETHDLEESWLMENLGKKGYRDLEDIIYAEWSEEKGFYIVTKDDTKDRDYKIDGWFLSDPPLKMEIV